jgi:tetratricopeptide (TPR) repeat protein
MRKDRKNRDQPAADRPSSPQIRRHLLPLAALWLLTLAPYANSFRDGLIFDSDAAILHDPRLFAATPGNVHALLTEEYWFEGKNSGLYRPLTKLNYAVLGEVANPVGYHVVNWVLHAVNVSLVYLLGLALLGESTWAFALAAFWGVHPVLTEAVTNVVGRADLLAAFGVLAGLLCHSRSVAARGRTRMAWLAGVMLAACIGLFSKESAVALPAAMFIWDLADRKPAAWRDRIPGYLALVPAFLAFFYARYRVLDGFFGMPAGFTENPLVGAGFWAARLTAIKVIGRYVWLLLWPSGLSCDYSYNQIPLARSLTDAWVLASLVLCVGAAATALGCWRRKHPGFFFIAFFFAALAPVSNLGVLIGSIMAERFLYLPAIGFAGCLVLAIRALGRRLAARNPGMRLAAPAIVAAICLACAGRTWARNSDWRDEASLWDSCAQVCPLSYMTHLGAAVSHMTGQPPADPQLVDRELALSLSILDPLPDSRNVALAYANAGFWYRTRGDSLRASGGGEFWYQQALAVLLRGARIDRAISEGVLRENRARGHEMAYFSASPGIYADLGRTYLRLSDPRNALEAVEYGRRVRPSPDFSEEMANAYRALNQPRQAVAALLEGLTLDPRAAAFGTQIAALYRELDPQGCEVAAQGRYLVLNQACPAVRDGLCEAAGNVARLYRETGQAAAAEALRSQAVRQRGCLATRFR